MAFESTHIRRKICLPLSILCAKVIEKLKPYTPFSSFLIEALGPISCKNLNKFSKKKCPKNLFLANHFWI